MEALEFYINGQWVKPSGQLRTLDVVNPATESVIGKIAVASKEDVDSAVVAARNAFAQFSRSSVDDRVGLLEGVLSAFKKRIAETAYAIRVTMGAPLTLAEGAQALSGVQHLEAAITALKEMSFEERVGQSLVVREPIGVCGLITPWNWPANQIACKVAPALAAGCTMILKPSEMTPFDAVIWAQCFAEAGVPAGVFNLIHGDGPGTGAALSSHPDVDMMSFTGSTRAGAEVSRAGATTVKRVALELGGKSPNIILDDADLETAVSNGVRDVFDNTGQSCNAPTRMLVPRKLMPQVVEIAQRVARSIRVGDPEDSQTEMGPLSSRVQFEKVQRLIQIGIDEGATLVAGGLGRPDSMTTGFFVKPTVFAGVKNTMTIAREEIFGPVLSIIPVDSEEEAIQVANDTPYGLSAYVSSSDPVRARNVGLQLRAGMVHINGAGLDSAAPFGGYKQSGNGREWGGFGIEEFLEVKALMGTV